MGSPEFALPALQRLADRYTVAGVVTQPDRPAGRGKGLTPPPVKRLANRLGIPVIQPEKIREPLAIEQLAAWQPDLIVVIAYGQILRQKVLDLPRLGCLNIHASLLPRWRGAAPIQAAILAGDNVTGVTIMKMDAGLDTGPILATRQEKIRPADTAESLGERLAVVGAELLMDTLPEYLEGRLQPQSQIEQLSTYAGLIKKKEGALDFEEPAEVLERRVRAFSPWPSTWFFWQGEMLKVLRARTMAGSQVEKGKRISLEGFPAIGTVSGWLVLEQVQPAGKKPMPGDVFLRGARGWQDED